MRGAWCAGLTEGQLGGLARTQLWGRHGWVCYITVCMRGKRKQVSSPNLGRKTSWHPHCPIPEKTTDRSSLLYSWCPQGHLLPQSGAFTSLVSWFTCPRPVFDQDGNCGDHEEQRETESMTLQTGSHVPGIPMDDYRFKSI